MWTDTDVTRRLGLRVPIIQGPFGGGLSSPSLVAAVSDAGGLGSFGVHHLSAQEIAETTRSIRSLTSAPFALNLWLPFDDSDTPRLSDEAFAQGVELLAPYFRELNLPLPSRPARFAPAYAEQIEAVLAARPAAFSFVYGIPATDILDRCRDLGIVTIGTATTPEEASALDQAGVDLIVATGFEAGGHRVSFLAPAEESLTGTFALIPQVVDRVKAPVIAAGGIADGRGIAAALALGAQGVQIGTAFLACQESGACATHRQALFSPAARHTGLTRAFSGRLARGIRNRFMDDMKPFEAQIPPYPVQTWLGSTIKDVAAEQGRSELLSLWCGQAAALIRHQAASALIDSLVEGTTRTISMALSCD